MLRISHVVAAATLVGGLAIAGLAAAGPRGDRADGPPPPFGGPVDFKVIDTDGDGSLSRAELMTRATTRIAVADANSDGSVDKDEMKAGRPPHGRGPDGEGKGGEHRGPPPGGSAPEGKGDKGL